MVLVFSISNFFFIKMARANIWMSFAAVIRHYLYLICRQIWTLPFTKSRIRFPFRLSAPIIVKFNVSARNWFELDSIFLAVYIINRFIFTFFQMTDECMKTIDEHQTFYYMEMVSDCWLFLRLQLLTSIFIGVLSCATVFYRDTMGKGVFPLKVVEF